MRAAARLGLVAVLRREGEEKAGWRDMFDSGRELGLGWGNEAAKVRAEGPGLEGGAAVVALEEEPGKAEGQRGRGPARWVEEEGTARLS